MLRPQPVAWGIVPLPRSCSCVLFVTDAIIVMCFMLCRARYRAKRSTHCGAAMLKVNTVVLSVDCNDNGSSVCTLCKVTW
jgi:hypothetical protein